MAQSNGRGTSYSVHHSVVTVNNGSGGGVTLGQVYLRSRVAAAGRVVVTPLTSRELTPVAVRLHALVNKVLIKAFLKGCKKEFKMFTLRNINTHDSEVNSVDKLQQAIKGQLGDEVSQNKFDVGYLQGANFVTVRNAADLVEVWTNIQKGVNIILWCDGLKKNTKSSQACRSQAVSSDIALTMMVVLKR